MAQKKKKPKFQRTDIPYSQRIIMKKHQEIKDHRDQAAMIALQIACVALNDTEGLGYMRLSRFAKQVQKLIQEFYSDPEVGSAHLKRRLEQLGFVVENGHMFAVEVTKTGEVIPSKLLEVQTTTDKEGEHHER